MHQFFGSSAQHNAESYCRFMLQPEGGGGVKQADVHILRDTFAPSQEFLSHVVELDRTVFYL